ncbi:MAG: FimV/HubP family polar landmark protein, partial [Gammaproteobacteria bacterium]|nr:FimV/HubP family polar landmark protein [Gammaproteobacteria bacterium]
MLKKLAVITALFFVTVSSNVHALGLGVIDMQSALNQPMKAVIDLTSASGTDLSQIKVSIASQQAHDRIGLSRSRILADFRFSVEQDSRGMAFIRITSSDALHEPFLEFLLELQWPKGRLLREYTVLVDPPVTMPARPAVPLAPVSQAPAPVFHSPIRQSRPMPVRTSTPPERTDNTAPSANSYGPVRRNDTLWNIAKRVRPDNDISMDQMMHALLRENPHAFINNNINRLQAGATLSIPDRNTIMSIAASEARAETNRQAREWKDEQGVSDQENEPQVPVQQEAVETVVATESHLQLTAPEDEAIEGLATASSGDPEAAEGQSTADLATQLALASEEAEASKAQSEELQSRVTELEDQIETMQRLLVLNDDALAGMQEQVASETATGTEVVEVDAPESSATEAVQEIGVDTLDEQLAEEEVEDLVAEAEAEPEPVTEPRGIVNKLMDNPVLAGLGILVALLLGGFLWASTRRKGYQSIFDEEMTLEKHMASETTMKDGQQAPEVDFDETLPEEETTPTEGHDDSDPVTEADVYLAYGRIQQAEDVLQTALEKTPENVELRIKLLEVYHAGENIAAFDREASNFRDSVAVDDNQWLRVAAMGYALSPENALYNTVGGDQEKSGDLDFDLDLSGMDNPVESSDVTKDSGAEVIDFEDT